jgi:aminopeptidase N
MAALLDEIVKLAEQLDPEQQNLLIYRLRVKQARQKAQKQAASVVPIEEFPEEWLLQQGSEYVEFYHDLTREELIDELNDLRSAGAFKKVESLYGKYANSDVPVMSEEAFHAQMHEIATEWEQELDEFDAD